MTLAKEVFEMLRNIASNLELVCYRLRHQKLWKWLSNFERPRKNASKKGFETGLKALHFRKLQNSMSRI